MKSRPSPATLRAIGTLALGLTVTRLPAAPVHRAEAIAAGDLWYAMEVNARHSQLDAEQKRVRRDSLPRRQVFELDARDELSATPLPTGAARAYILTYPIGGYVVVSGDDALHPVLVYGLESSFRWDSPERNYLRYFVTQTLAAAQDCLQLGDASGPKPPPHALWLRLRNRLRAGGSLDTAAFEDLAPPAPEAGREASAASSGVYVLMDTALWGQDTFYNAECVAHNTGQVVPTGCVATGAAIKMRYHRWPPSGVGSRTYDDGQGQVTAHHSVTFSHWSYDWNAMPVASLTNANVEVARLMYHCGVMVDMDYEVARSAAYTPDIARANDYFRYRGAEGKNSYDKSAIIQSVRAYLPVNVGGGGHSVVVDGYRNTPSEAFHLNAGWDGHCNNNWYTVGVHPTNSATCSTTPMASCVPYMAPDIYRYVDGQWRLFPDGSLQNAYETLAQAIDDVPDGSPWREVWVKAGTYTAPARMTKAFTLKPYHQGPVTLRP